MAQPKSKKGSSEVGGDKTIEKQSAWEQKVMGEDAAKKADAKKIANAQRLAEEARKNPPPEPVVHHKDPNKEGVRAKNEASIGLPIESEQEKAKAPKKVVAKKTEPSGSANDELGALVAASLASDKKPSEPAPTANESAGRGHGRKGKGRETAVKPEAAPSSLDRMFAGGK